MALQCRMRQRIAYGELRELRMRAKDVGNLKEENEKLKKQILEMRNNAAQAASAAGDEQVTADGLECLRYAVVTSGDLVVMRRRDARAWIRGV